MILLRTGRVLLLSVILTACTTIKTWFPDKEKNYQFQTEIAPLKVPEDLRPTVADSQNASTLPPSFSIPPPQEDLRQPDDPDDARLSESARMARVQYQGGVNGLRIFDGMGYSWRLVGKALARQALEIVARNRQTGVYLVHYNPSSKVVTDETFWDEIQFFFGRYNVGGDLEFQVKLIENAPEQYVDILILNEQNQPDSREQALELLNQLQTTLQQELAQ